MEISFSAGIGGPWTESHCCATTRYIPGQSLRLSAEERARAHSSGRLVRAVAPDKVFAVDSCWGRASLAEVDDNCRFIDRSKLGCPSLCSKVFFKVESLMMRNILVLDGEYVDRPSRGVLASEWMIVSRQLERTFFRRDEHTLINDTFACASISPREMALAGFRFAGSATDDRVACFSCASEISSWQAGDDPVLRYLEHSGCSGSALEVFQQRYPDSLPCLRDSAGQDQTGRRYTILMPLSSPQQPSTGTSFCRRAVLVTPLDYRLPELGPTEVSRALKNIDIDNLRRAINTETATKLTFSDALIEMIKQLIYMEHFDDLMDEFYPHSSQFQSRAGETGQNISCLDRTARSKLQIINCALQEFTAANIEPCIEVLCQQHIVKICQQRVAEKTSTDLQQVQLIEEQYKLDMLKENIIKKLAGRHYISDVMNGLMANDTLVHLSRGDGPFRHSTASDGESHHYHEVQLDALRHSAVQLNGILAELSNRVHDLLLF